MNYFCHLCIYFSIYSILALSLNIIVGYCGYLTLAHASYFAIGSYTCALLTMTGGWGFFPAILIAFLLGMVFSLIVSVPAWRLRGDFFVLASLAAQALIYSAIYNWATPSAPIGTWANLTNGPGGLPGIPRPLIFGIRFDTIGSMAVLSVMMATICLAFAHCILRSPWGRVLQAMRDDELAARGLGKEVRLLKVQAFGVACGMAAIAGAIHASYVGYIDPSLASLGQSILMLSMVIVGGIGNFRGPLVGAALLVGIPELLRFVNFPDQAAADVRLMVYGLLLVMLMHARPQGIAGIYRLE